MILYDISEGVLNTPRDMGLTLYIQIFQSIWISIQILKKLEPCDFCGSHSCLDFGFGIQD